MPERTLLPMLIPDLDPTLIESSQLSQFHTREEKILWLEEQYQNAQRCLAAIQYLRNSLAAIDALPNEILEKIMLLLANSYPYTSRWILVTHVCRRWRSVALGLPILWTGIDMTCLDRARIFLERSMPVPITIRWELTSKDMQGRKSSQDLADILSPHFQRITGVQVAQSFQHMYWFQHLILRHIPKLTTLNLRLDNQELPLMDFHYSRFGLDSEITEDSVWSFIQHLSLDAVTVNWSSPMYTNLRSLQLSGQNTPSDHSPPSMDTFLDVLERCPQLERLALEYAGPRLDSRVVSYPEPTRKITVEHLRIISLNNEPLDVAHLLAHLLVPGSASLEITSSFKSNPELELISILPRDRSDLGMLQEVASLALRSGERATMTIIGRRANLEEDEAVHFHLKWPIGWSTSLGFRHVYAESFSTLAEVFPRAPVRDLFIDCDISGFFRYDWHNLLSSFGNLEVLEVTATSETTETKRMGTENLFKALHASEGECVVEHLRQFTLRGIVMDRTLMESLQECVVSRLETKGIRLERLSLTSCPWMGEDALDLASLRALVNHLNYVEQLPRRRN